MSNTNMRGSRGRRGGGRNRGSPQQRAQNSPQTYKPNPNNKNPNETSNLQDNPETLSEVSPQTLPEPESKPESTFPAPLPTEQESSYIPEHIRNSSQKGKQNTPPNKSQQNTQQPHKKPSPQNPQQKSPQNQQPNKKPSPQNPQQMSPQNPQSNKTGNQPPAKSTPPPKQPETDAKKSAKGQVKNTPDPKPEEQEPGSLLTTATSGLFQFGQPVHGFTPMSFNFSLPTSDTLLTVEPELPSHSGPCVITTGGVTYSLEQKPTQTFEENEDLIFMDRAKLYRYDSDNNEWKERGVGDYKLLKHKETGKYRIIMRRDKILKLCANHIVSPYFSLKPHPSYPETCWVYQTDCDFSDEVINKWTLAVRFRTPEITKQFKEFYDRAQLEMKNLLPYITSTDPTDSEPDKPSSPSIPPRPADILENSKPTITFENVLPEFNIKMSLSKELNQADKPLLDVLYAEILQIKSTLKTMQNEWIELKNIIIASQK